MSKHERKIDRRVITLDFFRRPAPDVALDLIGKYLVRRIGEKEIGEMITETESYHGEDDLASHARSGRTKRTEVMFGEPGNFYIYLIYGMHLMLNIVTSEKDFPSAVLIRGTENTKGPGLIGKKFAIEMDLNGQPAIKKTGLWFEDRGVKITPEEIELAPRIGVPYAGEIWSKKLWRFMKK